MYDAGAPLSSPADSCPVLTESPLYGVPLEVIAATCQVHLDTARRWKRQGHAPARALALIRLLHEHDLGATSEAWAGWVMREGDLVSPEGDRFTPGMVRAGKYHRQRARELDRELTAALEFLERLREEYRRARARKLATPTPAELLSRDDRQLLLGAAMRFVAWANRQKDADEHQHAKREALEWFGWTDKPKEVAGAITDSPSG
jgi:hypothetical protein